MRIVTLNTGTLYSDPEDNYTGKLYNGLYRNTTKDFSFECSRHSDYPGWWGKIDVFNPKERTIFIDLDTIIVGNVDFLFEYDGPFAILRDPYRPDSNSYGSAIMSIAPGYGKHILDDFKANAESVMETLPGGDQCWIQRCVPKADFWQDMFPDKIKSFKADNVKYSTNGASIILFHGEPRPSMRKDISWMQQHWR